jgi:hypothetical protein
LSEGSLKPVCFFHSISGAADDLNRTKLPKLVFYYKKLHQTWNEEEKTQIILFEGSLIGLLAMAYVLFSISSHTSGPRPPKFSQAYSKLHVEP